MFFTRKPKNLKDPCDFGELRADAARARVLTFMRSGPRACFLRSLKDLPSLGPLGAWRYLRAAHAIIRSDLFDYYYYLHQNPEFDWSRNHPLVHFLEKGASERKNPNPLFDLNFYLANNPGVELSGMNPLAHYIEFGAAAGCDPHPMFSASFYARMYSDIGQSGVNPLMHYVYGGADEGRDPHPLFSTVFYTEVNTDVSRSINPLVHYVLYGAAEGRDPHPLLDVSAFSETDPLRVMREAVRNAEREGDRQRLAELSFMVKEIDKAAGPLTDTVPAPISFFRALTGSVRDGFRILRSLIRSRPAKKFFPSGWHADSADEYEAWIGRNEIHDPESVKAEIDGFKLHPKVSIILRQPDGGQCGFLDECIQSIRNQWYENWEILVNTAAPGPGDPGGLSRWTELDSRIGLNRLEDASDSGACNTALHSASGDYVVFLDTHCTLAPFALFEAVRAVNLSPAAQYLYSDHDRIDKAGRRVDPFFKPDWSPDLLLSFWYTRYLSIYRKEAVTSVGGLREEYEPCQEYDLLLRVSEKVEEDSIVHIPKILCHCSADQTDNSERTPGPIRSDNLNELRSVKSKEALREALGRRKIKGVVLDGNWPGSFRVKQDLIEEPLVSIIIPTRDRLSFVIRCIESIREKTTYGNYEILLVDNDSEEPETLQYFLTAPARVIKFSGPFNFARINNFAVARASGEYIILLNNDTEVISPDWIESMLEHARDERVGVVGCKLLYPHDRIQHAGVVMGISGVAGHIFRYLEDGDPGYFGLADVVRNCSAVTGAAMMLEKSLYEEMGGLEEDLPVNFNDVDLCLRLRKKGYSIVYTPFAKLYHHESVSRGPWSGSREEADLMMERWRHVIENDPFYSPNLSRKYICRVDT